MPALRELNADEVSVLAGILAKLRPHGARQWQPAGIRAALAKVADLDAANVLMAAVRLSQDRSAETPGQIAITSSECWRERVAESVPVHKPYSRQHTCGICGFAEDQCRARWATDHDFEPVGAAAGRRLEPDDAHAAVAELRDITRPALSARAQIRSGTASEDVIETSDEYVRGES